MGPYRVGMPRAHHRGCILDPLLGLQLPSNLLNATLVSVLFGFNVIIETVGESRHIMVSRDGPVFDQSVPMHLTAQHSLLAYRHVERLGRMCKRRKGKVVGVFAISTGR